MNWGVKFGSSPQGYDFGSCYHVIDRFFEITHTHFAVLLYVNIIELYGIML